ncbi:Clavaminate synthase-like protein [Tothia fuscella]|uniref:Clavaminate synthase-like protein n=1 Tax=Tothia fuscella TaxID=1048955 RepID=A0A9P4NGD0_9PEZI|nr:Clavaminate synthase-like protein [Tothia fuscella]
MTILTIDWSPITTGQPEGRSSVLRQLRSSLEACGFVRIVNHGLSEDFVNNLFELNDAFFHLAAEEKLRIANVPGPNPQRGWSQVGAENSASLYRQGLLQQSLDEKLSDAREHWDQGSANDLDFPNRWPGQKLIPEFRPTMENAFEQLEKVCHSIMSALEEAYQLPQGVFCKRMTHEKNASEFRFNHYPSIEIEKLRAGKIGRIWPHYDLGVITLLFQDQVGGLEIEDRPSGDFVPVETRSKSDLIVNVSEILTRWTNGRLPAGLHKVSLPPSLQNLEHGVVPERYSIAYFGKADRDASVGPLKEFVTGDKPRFEDMTAIQYHRQRLSSAY